MTSYKSRRRWLAERWLAEQRERLMAQARQLKTQLLPADWQTRCARMSLLVDSNIGGWQPRPGSSSAELAALLRSVPLVQRRWLASLLDAPSAGHLTLVEAVERAHLDWRSQLDPLHSHREYAAQLVILARQLKLPVVAQAAYLENEQQIFVAMDELLFASLPMRLRAQMVNRQPPGSGLYMAWWQDRLLARSGEADYTLEGLGDNDWPEMPPAWLALGWLCGLRLFAQGSAES
ncbi:MAG: hypothetical protein ACK4VV_00765 [Pseudomonas sp.]